MDLNDPYLMELYDDFIVKSLDYVVSGAKFLSYSTQGTAHIPRYVPAARRVGFENLFNEEIADIADNTMISTDFSHRFVRARINNGLSLFARDAYREIYDGNNRDDIRYKIYPVHYPLMRHIENSGDMYFHPLGSKENALAFADQNTSGPRAQPVYRKRDRMIFYAEVFGNQVNAGFKGNHADMADFNRTVVQHIDDIHSSTLAYTALAKTLDYSFR